MGADHRCRRGQSPHQSHPDHQTSYPVAAVLKASRVPFVLATSLEPWAVPASYVDVPLVPKPVSLEDLERQSG